MYNEASLSHRLRIGGRRFSRCSSDSSQYWHFILHWGGHRHTEHRNAGGWLQPVYTLSCKSQAPGLVIRFSLPQIPARNSLAQTRVEAPTLGDCQPPRLNISARQKLYPIYFSGSNFFGGTGACLALECTLVRFFDVGLQKLHQFI